tara:strand:- start:510 stop:1229 length:720 start_codon:yes stop_codon:yes gene_type:complete
MTNSLLKQIYSKKILRIGINMSNLLLVDRKNNDHLGGISPDIGRLLAKEFDVNYEFIKFKNPGELADAVNKDLWDVGNFAFEKKRAETIDFSNPYINIDANFLVDKKLNLKNNNEIFNSNLKIAVVNRSAYDLWLSDNLINPNLVKTQTIEDSHKLFLEKKVDVLAGLKPKLIEEIDNNDNLKILDNPFTQIKQSIGVKKGNDQMIKILNDFILKILNDGTIKNLLVKYNLKDKLSLPI